MMMRGKVIELVFRRGLGAPKTKRGKTDHVLVVLEIWYGSWDGA